jgi:hypothetical protein
MSVAPVSNAKPVASTPPMPINSAITQVANVRESSEGLTAMKKDIYNMSRDAKKYPEFTKALIAIGKMEYEEAYTILLNAADKNPKISAIIQQYNYTNLSSLQALNTYTYGARSSMDVKNQSSVSAKEYNAMRTAGVLTAENKLGVSNSDAEAFFKSTASHTAKDISVMFPGMNLSVSVYATPKGGAHRVDTFSGSIQASDAIYTGNFSEAQKDQILKNGTKNTQVAYDLFKKDFGKVVAGVSLADYTSYIKTGTLPQSMAGLSVKQPPVFFEARAMVHSNLCANKCEGVGYPRFSYQGKVDTPAPQTPSIETMPAEYGQGSVGTPGVMSKTGQLDVGAGIGVVIQKEPTKEPKKTPGDPPIGDGPKPPVEKPPVVPGTPVRTP